MNINDITASEEKPKDVLVAIFQRQRELMDKYHDIELRSGLMQTEDCPVDLNDPKGQARLKDFSWRITEELGEAMESLDRHPDNVDHFLEELVDGLHFLIEQLILIGYKPDSFLGFIKDNVSTASEYEEQDLMEYYMDNSPFINYSYHRAVRVFQVIGNLAMAMNCLKNKPWKQSHMLTDVDAFNEWMNRAFLSYMSMLDAEGLSPEDVYDLYFRKSEVNKFRQRSKY